MTGADGGPQAFDAVVLAGGRGSRAGGPGKPGLMVGERSLVASVVSAAVAAGALRVILVGPRRPELLAGAPRPAGGWVFVREEPPGSGPVPALRCGLAAAAAPLVAVLAADLPFLRDRHLRPLLTVLTDPGGAPGSVMVDDSGRQQWLAGCWRTPVLRSAVSAYTGRSLHGLLGPLAPAVIRYDLAPGEPPPWLDCDTAEDLARARHWQRGEAAGEHPAGMD